VIIGNPEMFAIESGITRAFPRLGARALGYFLIHVAGYEYGVRAPEATMLACSFDEVGRRLAERGTHTAPFSGESDGAAVARSVRLACYDTEAADQGFFGLSGSELESLVYSKKLLWAPDGDEAFDDDSFIVQLDVGSQVRLVAFRSSVDYDVDEGSLRDVVLSGDLFYSVLEEWWSRFEAEWAELIRSDSGEPESGASI
jgi:hypothetical protein